MIKQFMLITLVKVFTIFPEFRTFEANFPKKVDLKMLKCADNYNNYNFSDFLVSLKTIAQLNLKLLLI